MFEMEQTFVGARPSLFAMEVRTASRSMDGVELRCFPAADEDFVARVGDAARRLNGSATPETLEAQLKIEYPGVRVSEQAEIANFSVGQRTWYVFRDGRA